ncbi:MAG: amidohydrolase family protein [Oceanicaulis sp.]
MISIMLAALSLLDGAAAAQAAAQPDVAIRNVAVVDVTTGEHAVRDVLIDEGTIVAVTDPRQTEAARVVEGEGRYLAPGLWDSHVHVFSSAEEPATAFDMYLLNGVTGVRDMGALLPLAEQKRIQAAVESGDMRGPRLILSGAWVDASPGSWPGMFLADTPEEARARVAEIADQGWAAVKSYSMLREPVYLALAEATRDAGLPLVGHIPETVTLSTALEAGHGVMEHAGRLAKACSTQEAAMIARTAQALQAEDPRTAMISEMATHNRITLETHDPDLCTTVIARIAQSGMAVAPTLVVAGFYTGDRPDPDSERMTVLPTAVRAAWGEPDFRLDAMSDDLLAIADQSIALDHATLAAAHAAGVPVLASTDASFANPFLFHGYSLHDELARYVDLGMSPREALYSATVAPAAAFQLADQDGAIAPGRRADLILLDADPLLDLTTLQAPAAVIAHGRVYGREALSALRQGLLERADAP